MAVSVSFLFLPFFVACGVGGNRKNSRFEIKDALIILLNHLIVDRLESGPGEIIIINPVVLLQQVTRECACMEV